MGNDVVERWTYPGVKGMAFWSLFFLGILEFYGYYCDWEVEIGYTSNFSFGFSFWIIFCPCLALLLGFRDFVLLNRLRLNTCDLSIITSTCPI